MIAPLRSRHRKMLVFLAVVVPAVFAAGLASRRPTPTMDRLPARLEPGPAAAAPRSTVLARISPDRLEVEIAVRRPPHPDLLAYWTRQDVADRLPEDAVLLGPLTGDRVTTFSIPGSAREDFSAGRVVLYSLGHQEVAQTLLIGGDSPR